MKNKLFDIILFVFLLNNINIFSSNDTIKEVEPIESIHSDEKKSVSSDIIDKENIISENSLSEESILEAPRKDYTSDELKTTNIISTNKDLKTNKKEENSREDKFEEITDRTNRITALGSAMGAVDLGKIEERKFRIYKEIKDKGILEETKSVYKITDADIKEFEKRLQEEENEKRLKE